MFPKRDLPDYFVNSFWRELTSPQGWLALFFLVLIGTLILSERYYSPHPFNRILRSLKSQLMTTGGMIAMGIRLYMLFNLTGVQKGPFSLLVRGETIWCLHWLSSGQA